VSCEECSELSTHVFRSPEDLIHAVRVATEEMNRGVLREVEAQARGPAEDEAMESVRSSGALPGRVHYRFRCAVCGDHFTLLADTDHGRGGWTREDGKEDMTHADGRGRELDA
jgi:hypothetical protein